MTQILFVTPYYPPEKGAAQVRISETARCLVERGYEVTVLTTLPNYPAGIVPEEYRGRQRREERRDGVRIVRVWSYISPNKGFFRRILAQLSFGCLAPLLGWRKIGRPDLIIVESPPLFNALAGRMLSRFTGRPFIFTVSDIWPESAVQLGVLRNRRLIRLAEHLEWSTYQRAGLVWAVTEGIRSTLIGRGLPAEKVFLLTNGVDTEKFRPLPQRQARAEFDLPPSFIVLYAGTHGIAQGLMTVIEAAQRLREYADIQFVLAGDGAEKQMLIDETRQRGLSNMLFLDPLSHERMPLLWSASDVCLVPLRKLPLFEGALPSKMYEVMACTRPIILGVDGEARKLLEKEAKSAIAVEPENIDELVSAILYMYKHPEERERLGKQARSFVQGRFDRKQLVSTLETQMRSLLKQSG